MEHQGISRWDKKIISEELDQDWINKTIYILNNIDSYESPTYKIPLISHSIYYTKDTSPIKLKELYVKKSSICVKKLNAAEASFKHYIWTNNPNIDIGVLSNNVELKLINEFSTHPLYHNIENLLEQGKLSIRKLVQASDVTRIMVMQTYGGIYHDLDYEIFEAFILLKYMRSFNYFNGREFDFHDSFIGNAFFAANAHHPVLNTMVDLILRNLNDIPKAPQYVQFPLNQDDEIFIRTGPVAMTIASYKGMNISPNIDVIFPAAVFYNAKKVNPEIVLSVSNDFYGIVVPTVGADMFSGHWGKEEEPVIVTKEAPKTISKKMVVFFSSLWENIYSFYENLFYKKGSNSMSTELDIDKIYVINLEKSTQRWQKVAKSLDKLAINYERFNAINALDIVVMDKESKVAYSGLELKKDLSLLKYYHKYTVTCNPTESNPLQFNYEHIEVDYRYSIGYLGVMCSNFMIAKEIVEKKYKYAIIFEDDIEVTPNDFKTKLANYLNHLPQTFDFAYLGTYSDKDKQIKVNDYVNSFAYGANFFCRMGVVLSYKGAEKLLLNDLYWGSFDHFIRAKSVYMPIPNTSQFALEIYISKELQELIYVTSNSSDIQEMQQDFSVVNMMGEAEAL